MTSISIKMFLVVTLPVMIGMIIRKFATKFVLSNNAGIEKFSILLFLVVFIAIWIEEWNNIAMYITQGGLITLVLNIVMMFLGYYIAKIFTTGIEQRKCISLECGVQNGTLAVFVATQLFDETIYLIPTAAYALVMFITSILFVLVVRKIN